MADHSRGRRNVVIAVGVVLAWLAGCAAVSGVGDLNEVSCAIDCGATTSDAGNDAQLDAATDRGSSDAAGDPRLDAPLADGCQCVPPIPTGFSLVAFDPTGRPACPSGFGSVTDVSVDPNLGPATCGCACTATSSPSCTSGTLDEFFANVPSCAGAGDNLLPVDGGGCSQHGFSSVSAYHLVAPLPPTGGTCGQAATTTLPTAGTLGRTCAAPTVVDADCGTGVCAPPAAPFGACVAMAGDVPCPGTYPNRHIVGTSVTDTRACSGCSCASTPTAACTNASLTLYEQSSCAGQTVTLVADGQCNPNASGLIANGFTYAATVSNVACAVSTTPSPTGSASISGLATVCCP